MVTRQSVEFSGRKKAGARWQDGELIARQLGLFDMYVDPNDTSLSGHLVHDGYWESWITAWTMNTVGKDWNCVDIGANQGYFTFLLATIAPEGLVYAFEPLPLYFEMLNKTRELGGYHNVQLFMHAVSDQIGSATLATPGSLRGSASIAIEEFDKKWGETTTTEVSTVPLDLYGPGRVDFVKIDAEGAEPEIWAGMQQTIQRNPSIVIAMEYDSSRWPAEKTEAFVKDMQSKMNITYIGLDGREYPATQQILFDSSDWAMLVLRHR